METIGPLIALLVMFLVSIAVGSAVVRVNRHAEKRDAPLRRGRR